jgi:HNH endonuclease
MALRACPRGHLRRSNIPRCPECERSRDKERLATDPVRRVTASKEWQKVRALVRRRDRGCRLAGEGECWGRLEVHHLVPVRSGGAPYDLANLVLVCRSHHELVERLTREK